MLTARVCRTIPKLKNSTIRLQSQASALEQDEYTETPEYPPILDMSLQGRKLRERQQLFDNIKKIKTIEEKQIALNMPRYYGWRCIMFNDKYVPYNAMPMIQCYTRSHFIPMAKLPDIYNENEELAASFVNETKSYIEDAIAFEHEGIERKLNSSDSKAEKPVLEDEHTRCIVKQINRVITNNLTDRVPHILSAQVDYDPRLEAFWFVGGVDVPAKVIEWRKQYPWFKKRLYENIDRPVQYLGSPLLTLRSKLPLKPILPYSESENPEFKVPKFTFVPKSVGFYEDFRHGTNIPGFWPGDQDEYGLLSYHGCSHILNRKETYGSEDNTEALHCQALTASFGWLLAQASYQGFTPYNDITYPLVTQSVITNGQLWSLYAYQLNTIEMHGEKMDDNKKHNICFGTPPLKLYESIEEGKVKGLNEDVLKMLIQFYLNAPEERDHEMKPYLDKEEQVVADIENDRRRCWLEERYKLLVSNRPKHFLMPEVYLWEKIYKIKYNTRPTEPKRRPFELGVNPFNRKLNEHLPKYIPRVLRKQPKSKTRFEVTYYPKI